MWNLTLNLDVFRWGAAGSSCWARAPPAASPSSDAHARCCVRWGTVRPTCAGSPAPTCEPPWFAWLAEKATRGTVVDSIQPPATTDTLTSSLNINGRVAISRVALSLSSWSMCLLIAKWQWNVYTDQTGRVGKVFHGISVNYLWLKDQTYSDCAFVDLRMCQIRI